MTNAVATAEDNKGLILGALQDLGLASQGGDQKWGRAKINGTTLDLDGHVFLGNNEDDTLYIRMLDVPLEYQGMWITPQDAMILERPDAAESYCKSYYHIEEQGGKFSEDGTNCEDCIVMPYTKRDDSPLEQKKKCSWRADVLFEWVNNLGEKQDDRTWTQSLATTGVIELKGTSKKPEEGYVNKTNFMIRLAHFGIKTFPDKDPKVAIAMIGAALKTGRVISSMKVVQMTGGARNFPVIVLDPINVILDEAPPEQVAASAGPAEAADPAEDLDDLPF
ncbi:MAG: hypothetical protein DRR06_14655 [Gammaproteobacteria bacterium]|nr:MAG: hypothetical protein DRR06_14655 [Gammaproteobacteria bacterium]